MRHLDQKIKKLDPCRTYPLEALAEGDLAAEMYLTYLYTRHWNVPLRQEIRASGNRWQQIYSGPETARRERIR